MRGVIHVEEATVEATTGHMLVAFNSGGDAFRFYLPAHVALRFRHAIMRDGWQVLCAPDAPVIPFSGNASRVRVSRNERR